MDIEQEEGGGNSLTLRGFVRVALVDKNTGLILGDTGFQPNKIQARGFQNMICNPIASSTQAGTATNQWMPPTFMGLGSFVGAVNSTNFSNLVLTAQAGSGGPSNGKVAASMSFVATTEGGTIRSTSTWAGATMLAASGDVTINAIAMYHTSDTSAQALCAVTYTASTWSSDQDVKATYELRFTQA